MAKSVRNSVGKVVEPVFRTHAVMREACNNPGRRLRPWHLAPVTQRWPDCGELPRVESTDVVYEPVTAGAVRS